jgi:hypothetical protein
LEERRRRKMNGLGRTKGYKGRVNRRREIEKKTWTRSDPRAPRINTWGKTEKKNNHRSVSYRGGVNKSSKSGKKNMEQLRSESTVKDKHGGGADKKKAYHPSSYNAGVNKSREKKEGDREPTMARTG